MINLAGSKDANLVINRELKVCRIDPVEHTENVPGEVPTNLTGKLGPFEFHRAWYYWIVKGPVPLNVARKLYADPAGRYDVRAGGHCGCVEPETQCYGNVVNTYHIDSEVGLRLFTDTLRKHGLDTP